MNYQKCWRNTHSPSRFLAIIVSNEQTELIGGIPGLVCERVGPNPIGVQDQLLRRIGNKNGLCGKWDTSADS